MLFGVRLRKTTVTENRKRVTRGLVAGKQKTMSNENEPDHRNPKKSGMSIPIGIAIGLALGAGIGAAVGNLAAGVAIGILIGAVLGIILNGRRDAPEK